MKNLSLTGSWLFRQAGTQDWRPANVPGGVHTDLMALSLIPDPFVGDNEKAVQWVAEKDWEYKRQFSVSTDLMQTPQIDLVCDGLDTLAVVYLNGKELGKTNNMFRQYRWDVKALLTAENNELLIVFSSPVQYCKTQQEVRYLQGVTQAISGGPHLRKAPCQFGWDWGPQLPPIGIWKDIRLEGTTAARLEEVHVQQIHQDGKVFIKANLKIKNFQTKSYNGKLSVTSPDGAVIKTNAEILDQGTLQVEIPDPQLWWPNGYGDQPLYRVQVTLSNDQEELDQRSYRLGLRTIELRQEPDQWGKSFTFVVNGLTIFAKGSNWIPADSFPTRITDDYLEMLIRAAVDTNQNMLRVWGGGFFEEDRFYDLCDQYGVLVWQDFIFACSIYPLDDPEFLENLRVEVEENVRRLRHRTSLALWCGNNEMEWGWAAWGWKGEESQVLKEAYDQFFHHTLPQWCAALDPDHTYWPSSPSSDIPFEDPNGQKQGDAHYWDVWHGRQPFTAYRSQYPRFMSEFGFQALPPLETIRTYAEEADWNMTSYIMERHQKNDSGNQLMVAQMLDTFRLPKDFESLIYLSLVLQAEGIRYGVEHWRRFPQRVSGTLYWQLNDCWPVASWSSLDYYGRWKALHYSAKRFYAPVMMSIEDQPVQQDVYITNDTSNNLTGTLSWSLETLDGKTIKSDKIDVEADPFNVTSLCKLDFSDQLTDQIVRDCVFVAELSLDNQPTSIQTAFFAPTKHLNLNDPRISTQIKVEKDQLMITLTAKTLARLVEVKIEGLDLVFSDNYFDLPANRPATITCPLPAGWTMTQIETALKIQSVYNSYAHGAA